MNAMLFFKTPHDKLCEHPADLPLVREEIKEGPITGWDCYAPNFKKPQEVIGPFEAVVQRMGPNAWSGSQGEVYIVAPDGTKFFYGTESRFFIGEWRHPCWYQSETTLRFVRKPGVTPMKTPLI